MSPALRRGAEAAAIAALAALQAPALVVPWAWPLPWLAIAVLVCRLGTASGARHAALLGWCYGTAGLAAAVWWLFISMHRYGHLPAWMAAAAVLALCGLLALYLALACALYARWRRGSPLADALLFAGLWGLAELARGLLFTGFPWASIGYTQLDAPLAALAPWVGVYGIGAALAGLAGSLGQWPLAGRRQRLAIAGTTAAALVVAALAGPGSFTAGGRTLQVSLLQTNVAQDEKFAAERMPEALQWVAMQLTASRADLVVAPETAVPLLPAQLAEVAPGYWEALRGHFSASSHAALVGVPLGDFDSGYTNSVVGLSSAAAALPGGQYRYDKLHLVPFGEFIPYGFRWFTELMNIPLGDFARGVRNPPSFAFDGERAAPNICYEDLFGEQLALRFVDPARAPTLLVNVSNIAWFGDTVAVAQHLNISRMRALEFQRPMLRATNTGATAIIDHRARVTAQLPAFRRGVLEGSVQGRSGTTPYAWWAARAGLWPLAAAAVLVLGVLRRRAGAPAGARPRR